MSPPGLASIPAKFNPAESSTGINQSNYLGLSNKLAMTSQDFCHPEPSELKCRICFEDQSPLYRLSCQCRNGNDRVHGYCMHAYIARILLTKGIPIRCEVCLEIIYNPPHPTKKISCKRRWKTREEITFPQIICFIISVLMEAGVLAAFIITLTNKALLVFPILLSLASITLSVIVTFTRHPRKHFNIHKTGILLPYQSQSISTSCSSIQIKFEK